MKKFTNLDELSLSVNRQSMSVYRDSGGYDILIY